jgi:predicted Rossmann fold nucleotide-binding protein DprA/Smf involved in DNA uptake
MPAHTTLHELLTSEAGSSIRELTLVELREALAGFVQAASQASGQTSGLGSGLGSGQAPRRTGEAPGTTSGHSNAGLGSGSGNLGSNAAPESREARLYRQIIEAVGSEPKTIGQLAKVVDVDVVELRGYLAWMKKMGKIDSSGRARATRYHLRAG